MFHQEQEIVTLEEAIEIAKKANEYARQVIKKSATYLSANQYLLNGELSFWNSVCNGIADIRELLKNLYKKAVSSVEFTKEEVSCLSEHLGEDNKTEVMKFFGVSSNTRSNLEKIINDLNASINEHKKKFD